MMYDITQVEYQLIENLAAKLYTGSRGADCPSTGTKIIRLLCELEQIKSKKPKDEGEKDV